VRNFHRPAAPALRAQALQPRPPATKIGYLFGSDQQSGIARDTATPLLNKGSTDVYKLRTGDKTDFVRLHIPGNFRRQAYGEIQDDIALVLNLISDADQNPEVLAFADKRLASFTGQVLNRPKAVLASTRDQVAQQLAAIDGLIAPKVARFPGRANLAEAAAARIGLRFPAILRRIGTHSGKIVAIVQSAAELPALLQADLNYVLTEFFDARGSDGLYHKYRVFFFRQTGLVRHRLVSDHWNVHAADRMRFLIHHPELIALERDMIEGGMAAFPSGARAALTQVQATLPLDFFGIDFTILPDGRVLLFEANATMEFFPVSTAPQFPYGAKVLQAGEQAFNAMLTAAMPAAMRHV
jgi:hypothetical protein